MENIFKKSAVVCLVMASCFAQAQVTNPCDSTCGNGAMNWRAITPLYAQERETPVVNNITNTTQNVTQQVTQQVTQVVQPNTYQANGSGSGWRQASAYADCGGSTLLGGGGSCSAPEGFTVLATSQPQGNGWIVTCDTTKDQMNYASAYAVCSN